MGRFFLVATREFRTFAAPMVTGDCLGGARSQRDHKSASTPGSLEFRSFSNI